MDQTREVVVSALLDIVEIKNEGLLANGCHGGQHVSHRAGVAGREHDRADVVLVGRVLKQELLLCVDGIHQAQKGQQTCHIAKSIGLFPNCIPTFTAGQVSKERKGFMLSEQELVQGCGRGDRATQKALYERYCKKMMVICQRYARSSQEAEDSLQEGFIRVFKSIKDFRQESRLDTWITRIMINTALNGQRQKLYMLPMVDVTEVSIPEREDVSLAAFQLSELIAIVQSLPDGCRVVFNLFAIEGYSHREIGEMLKVSEGTSKSQYNRAKSLLRAKLEKETNYAKLGEASI